MKEANNIGIYRHVTEMFHRLLFCISVSDDVSPFLMKNHMTHSPLSEFQVNRKKNPTKTNKKGKAIKSK